jgi:hypothetical protein
MTVMLYKSPGPHKFHGGDFDYIVVEEADVAACVAEGWALTTTEASDKPKRGRKPKVEE